MKDELIKLFEQMVREIDETLPADSAWGSGSIWKSGSLNTIARGITFYQFMKWLTPNNPPLKRVINLQSDNKTGK